MIYFDLSHKKNSILGLIKVYNFYLCPVLYAAAKAHEKSQSHLRILRISKKNLINVYVCSQSSKTRNNRDWLEINTSKIRCLANETDDLTYSQQVQGLGTALKILFSGHEFDDGKFEKSRHFQLRRSEIVSLFNGFGRWDFT